QECERPGQPPGAPTQGRCGPPSLPQSALTPPDVVGSPAPQTSRREPACELNHHTYSATDWMHIGPPGILTSIRSAARWRALLVARRGRPSTRARFAAPAASLR